MFCLWTSAIKRSPKRAINVHIMSLPSQLLLCFGAIWNGFSVAFVLRQLEQTQILLKFPNNQFNSRCRKASVTEKVLGLCHWKWLENGRKILVVKRERERELSAPKLCFASVHSFKWFRSFLSLVEVEEGAPNSTKWFCRGLSAPKFFTMTFCHENWTPILKNNLLPSG